MGGTASVTYFQHTDHLGSPVLITNRFAQPVRWNDYEPYGLPVGRDHADTPGFTGHVEDSASELLYMQQRYYDPAIGRFLSLDPVTANGNTGGNFNRYWYANDNPYRFKDPDGREVCKIGGQCFGNPFEKDMERKYSLQAAAGTAAAHASKVQNRRLPNGEPPAGPFEPSETKGEVVENGMVQRNEAVKSNIATLRAAMDIKGLKAVPLIVTGGESYVAKDGRVRSVTDGSLIPNRLSTSAHNVENGSRAIDLRAPSMPHGQFIHIVTEFTEFTNNTNDYADMHDHLGLPNRPEFNCSSSVCTEP
ncbi:RHS repeat-associated core domain-containing protein [Lysobacter solisilvae]|uniref:RHS repeat-associated core domain-containing protein n=2 Tax=Agrilutibacter solisilvae TaxID=2763317 RepID=A0A974Y3J6_9GAMM|nr:RHS repeat-associated core domain-containing protein [Lysobacter solisilvae]